MSPYFAGLMSGTSVDGIDAVLVQFDPFVITATYHQHFSPEQRQQILALTVEGENEVERLGSLDCALGDQFSRAVNHLLDIADIDPSEVAAIGSHGQTIRHHPERGFTLQIGDPNCIAEHCGITTVADFRRRDIAAGGQGAPLVPAFHEWLFANDKIDRVIVNIGGMSNITTLPADRNQKNILGFDTGPGNVLLDSWASQHLGTPFDEDGNWGRSGQTHQALLEQMLADHFFAMAPPKSTGREHFNQAWLDNHLRDFPALAPVDVQSTLVELTAHTIADAIRTQQYDSAEVYLCGGGTHNDYLNERIQAQLPNARVATTSVIGLDPDWVEAVAFAWLAWRTLNHQSGNLPAVTGARGERVLGAIYPA